MKHLVVLTGAGMSAESGLKTFRESNGLWENHDVQKVASPEGFRENPELVLEFYNQRRTQLLNAKPNSAHFELARLEKKYKVSIVTQNVDDLHERAGSTNVLHLHGELFKVRSSYNPNLIFEWKKDLFVGDKCPEGYQLRPHIVWFGEAVPEMENAIHTVKSADILLIIGTSLQVYPAASLINFVTKDTEIYYIDPNPTINLDDKLKVIPENAGIGIKLFLNLLN